LKKNISRFISLSLDNVYHHLTCCDFDGLGWLMVILHDRIDLHWCYARSEQWTWNVRKQNDLKYERWGRSKALPSNKKPWRWLWSIFPEPVHGA
jgi:hypothetical protein